MACSHLQVVGQELVGGADVLVELAHALGPVHNVKGIPRACPSQVLRRFQHYVLQPLRIHQAQRVRLRNHHILNLRAGPVMLCQDIYSVHARLLSYATFQKMS